MAGFYEEKDLIRFVEGNGFDFVEGTGSHMKYAHKITNLATIIPSHKKGISIGVGDKIVDYVVLNNYILFEETTIPKKCSDMFSKTVYRSVSKLRKEGPIGVYDINRRNITNVHSNIDLMNEVITPKRKECNIHEKDLGFSK